MPFPRPEQPKKPKAVPRPGVEPGDSVYAQHPARGPITLRVLSKGADGITGQCDQGQRHRIPWDGVLGHKTRMLNRYRVADSGGDGMILEDTTGKRRYLEASIEGAAEAPTEPAIPKPHRPAKDDPLLAGEAKLRKATTMRDDLPILFLKAEALANRQGLHLEGRTDKMGHQTKRWVKTNKDEPGGEPKAAPIQHGDEIKFRHKDVEGSGRVFASGADGVSVKDAGGRDHQVRHEHIVHPEHGTTAAERGESPNGDGETAAKPDGQTAGQPGGGGTAGLLPSDLVKGLPPAATQPFSDEDQLFKVSAEALTHLKGWLNQGEGICDKLGFKTMAGGMDGVDWATPGGMLFIAPVKGKKRATEKVQNDYDGEWSKLKDTVRCSIAVDTLDELPGVIAALQKSGLKLAQQPKDRFAKPTPVGYRDMLLNIELPPDGLIGELQLHVKPMLQAKGDGHHYYETERTLDPKKKAGTLTPEEQKSYDAAIAAQEQIYAPAWQKATGSGDGGSGTTKQMQKALEMGEKFSFFDHDGAQFRRDNASGARSVDDVLADGKWAPYQGEDKLEPALFGDEIDDPSATGDAAAEGTDGAGPDGDADKPMAKSLLSRMILFLRR